MKNYFDFRQRWQRFFGINLLYLLVTGMYLWYNISTAMNDLAAMSLGVRSGADSLSFLSVSSSAGDPFADLAFSLGFSFVCLLIGFVFVRFWVEGVVYKGEALRTGYRFLRYLWLVVWGGVLTILTLGVFYPWYATRLIRFFSENASYRGRGFGFGGSGASYFCILTFALIIPVSVLCAVLFPISLFIEKGSGWALLFFPVCAVVLVAVISNAVGLVYKWFIDFSHGDRRVKLEAPLWQTLLFLCLQTLLLILTLGLYYPAAQVLIYRYLVRRSVIVSAAGARIGRFGYDGEAEWDVLYVFGQALLRLVTLGLYAPWAIVRVSRRLARRTYIEYPDAGEQQAGV